MHQGRVLKGGVESWSGVLETPNWSGVLGTPNWSGVLIEHMNRGVFHLK